MEAGGTEACLARQSNTGLREENWVQIVVHISHGVADWREIQYTKGEGDGSRNQSNGGTGFNKTLTLATEPRLIAVPDKG